MRPPFDVVNRRLLSVEVDGQVWIKRGSVIAYHGGLRFHLEPVVQAERVGFASGPLRSALKREAVPLVRAEGRGRLYLSNDGKFNHVVHLNDESLYVMSRSLLAFETTLAHEILMTGGVGLLAGGLLVVKLSGTGQVAFSTHGDPLTLRVAASDPVSTDPTATIAWTPGLWPALKTDLDAASLIAHGGGEPIQMCFQGEGEVIVHARNRAEVLRAGLIRTPTSWLTKPFL